MGPPAETYYQAPPPYQGPPPASYPGPTGYPAFTHAPPPPYPYYSPTPFVHSRPTNGLAIAAMVTSIICLVTLTFCLPIGVVGAIMGHIARGQIRRSNEDGEGFALAGVIIGWLGLALFVLAILLFAAPFLLLLGLIGASG
ncbi:MAG: DUF4190 domain-containing protein [Corynebacteriales bacterium]|nr:DUF4190 domain-containing protein [Mycobacteriales bacterium]